MSAASYEKVKKILIDRFMIDPNKIHPEADIQKDLQLDSMDAVDLMLALNEAFSIRIPEKSLANVHTVAALVQVIQDNKKVF